MNQPRTATPDTETQLAIGETAALACILEASVPKPGNVHRGADFKDVSFVDFMASAAMIARPMDRIAEGDPIGRCVLHAVSATRHCVATNTNLGTILLLAPLAAVPRETPLASGIQSVLQSFNADDSACIYEAIRIAQPGGIGNVPQFDICDDAPQDLVVAMRASAEHDLIARQYSNGFHEVLQVVLPWIQEEVQAGLSFTHAVLRTHLRMMTQYPDSLITRKCGIQVAGDAALLAQAVLDAGAPGDESFLHALSDFDNWLRSDGNRRNPGTTADFIAAAIFAGLREGLLQPAACRG